MKKYNILITDIEVDTNAPEWAEMTIDWNNQVITIETAYNPKTEKEQFTREVGEYFNSETITFDIEREVEIYSVYIAFEILNWGERKWQVKKDW